MRRSLLAFLFAAASISPAAAAPSPTCMGDCNADGRVAIGELVQMVSAALAGVASPCSASDAAVAVTDVMAAVGFALEGCPPVGPPETPTMGTPPPETPSPVPTATSCRAVKPVVAPVAPVTDELEATIILCGIGYASSRVDACGPGGCIEAYDSVDECPLQCPDSRQACVSGKVPLVPNALNTIQVCQVPGIGCGPLPDLCAEEDVHGTPLVIEQQVAYSE